MHACVGLQIIKARHPAGQISWIKLVLQSQGVADICCTCLLRSACLQAGWLVTYSLEPGVQMRASSSAVCLLSECAGAVP